MRVRPVSWAVLALMLFVVPIAHAAPLGETAARAPRRYALVLSQNLGDPSDEPLRFADEDARRIIETLQDVGGVAQTDAVVLHGATAPLVRRRFAELLKRLEREATARDQLIVYASSHADSGELHLAGTRLPLSELTSFIARAPVGVALLIVDSCRSGALTRLKGLKPVDGTQLQVHTEGCRGSHRTAT